MEMVGVCVCVCVCVRESSPSRNTSVSPMRGQSRSHQLDTSYQRGTQLLKLPICTLRRRLRPVPRRRLFLTAADCVRALRALRCVPGLI